MWRMDIAHGKYKAKDAEKTHTTINRRAIQQEAVCEAAGHENAAHENAART
jgi:hypothetical protein